ncbi:hypothetical protein [Pseudogemmobacter humi]|uniref:Uncharacterized protein n=1 Tax=Pseudogemmobacter humi TaxID=2483812 RepID=A0A3P5WTR7_9RHOB|nr:hypothetical protein [Pseudogemmobacter humi]VDC22691.1 hypothetical protein XINFAN_00855 [Pseudogemmobacter humi]
MSALTQTERDILAGIADYLIPEAEGMPSASQVNLASELADRVFAVRHDLVGPVRGALGKVPGLAGEVAAKKLADIDPEGFHAITTVASAGYFMSPKTREALGYPGQESRPFDPDKTTDYLEDGLLQPVIDRGPIYKPTPGL